MPDTYITYLNLHNNSVQITTKQASSQVCVPNHYATLPFNAMVCDIQILYSLRLR